MEIQLNSRQVTKLLNLDPAIEKKGGFQQFAIRLRKKLNPTTGVLDLNASDIEKVQGYISRYGRGGWQTLYRDICKQAIDK